MRILGGFALLATSLAVTACQTTQQQTAEQQKVASFSERVDATLRDAAASAEQRGDYLGALSHYRSAYKRDKTNLTTILGLSRALRNVGRPKEAIAINERGLQVYKRNPDILAELGKAQLADGDPMAAIDSLSRSGALQPGDWRVDSALGVAYDRIGMYDQAARRYQFALEQNATNPVVLNNIALSKAQIGKLDEAIVILEKAASMPDATAHVRQNLALLYAAKGRIDSAEQLVRRDLDEQTANDNMLYYRWLSRNNRDEPVAVPVKPSGPSSRSGTNIVTLQVSKGDIPASDVLATRPSHGVKVTPIVPPPPPDMREAAPGTEVSSAETAPRKTKSRPSPGDVRVEPSAPSAPTAPTAPSDTALDRSPPTETDSQVQDLAAATSPRGESAIREKPPAEAGARETQSAPETQSEKSAVSTESERTEVTPRTPLAATLRDQVDEPATVAARPAVPAWGLSEMDSTPDASSKADGAPIAHTPPVKSETSTPPPSSPTEARAGARGGDATTAEKKEFAARARTDEATTPASSASTGRDASVFRVQLGSYRNRDDANKGIQILQTSHGDILEKVELGIMAVTLPEVGDYFRVMTAPFASRVAAAEVCRKFKSREVGCLVLRRR